MILDGKNTAALRKERLATYVREEREAGRVPLCRRYASG